MPTRPGTRSSRATGRTREPARRSLQAAAAIVAAVARAFETSENQIRKRGAHFARRAAAWLGRYETRVCPPHL
jgi:hypothetical protein